MRISVLDGYLYSYRLFDYLRVYCFLRLHEMLYCFGFYCSGTRYSFIHASVGLAAKCV